MNNHAQPGWATRLSMVRVALARQPKIQKMLDEVLVDAQAHATRDGIVSACVAIDAFVTTLRSNPDVSAKDVLDGVTMLANGLRQQEVPRG